MSVKSSIYFYYFNVIKMGYDYKATIQNFCEFADEVVCATIPSDDGTLEALKEMQEQYPNFKIVESDIKLSDNRFDGKLKTVALKATTNPIKIIADGDERFLLWQRPLWEGLYDMLAEVRKDGVDGMMIPVVDLWGDRNRIRIDKQIGQKFRIHLDTIKSRGVIPEAEMADGFFDTTLSDSTEALDANGRLGRFMSIVPFNILHPLFSRQLVDFPYVIHEGYLDIGHRAKTIATFWKPHWEARSGHEEEVETDEGVLNSYPTIDHGIPTDNTPPPEKPSDPDRKYVN